MKDPQKFWPFVISFTLTLIVLFSVQKALVSSKAGRQEIQSEEEYNTEVENGVFKAEV